MSNSFAERLDTQRREAVAEAEAALAAHGFQRNGDGAWHGTLDLGPHGSIPARVRLPTRFPDELPDIFIEPGVLASPVPHIERSGRICLASRTGTVLDTSQPRALLVEALGRATNTLVEGLSGANMHEFSDEIAAYWMDENIGYVWSICNPIGPARPITCSWLQRAGKTQPSHRLFADSRAAARIWAHRTGWGVGRSQAAFFLPLAAPFLPPIPGQSMTFTDVQDLVQRYASPETLQVFIEWLPTVSLPVALLMALPLRGTQGVALVGIELEALRGAAARQAQRGFRPNNVPAVHALRFQNGQPVKRLFIERLDPTYLLPRGGAHAALSGRTIVIIGCGSVGSHIASHLAALGVNQLRLIDPDRLAGGNIHRHVLGASYIGYNKACGMAIEIGRRYPHLVAEYRDKDIETVLRDEPTFVTEADLIMLAIGDVTTELRLNDLLAARRPRLHVWVEPLGLGGHVLATGVADRPGCYHCLYEQDEAFGLVNRAAFAAPGQSFQRTMGGCAGQFVPFAALDANRIAGEAARLAVQILTGTEQENVLVSVREGVGAFLDAGFVLASRARLLHEGERCRETRHARLDCPSCSRWRQ